MRFDELEPEERRQLAEQIGCTFEGCDTDDDIWLTIEGKVGTPAEGQISLVCETHTRAMLEMDAEEWAAKVVSVDIIDLGSASTN